LGLLSTAEGFGQLATLGLERPLERALPPEARRRAEETRRRREEFLTPTTPAQRAGKQAEQFAEFLVPIPGLQELRAVEGAGLGTRMLYGALREGADVGLRTAAQTGTAHEGAKGAATGAILGGSADVLLRPVADLLSTWARSQYAKVLHPLGRSAKEVTEEKLLTGGPQDLVGRRVTGLTQNRLIQKLSDRAEEAGNRVGAAVDALSPTARTRLAPVFADIHNFLRQEAILPNGKIGRPALYAEGLEMMDRISNSLGDRMADVDPKTVRSFRQMLDRELYGRKLGVQPETEQDVILNRAVNSIRDALNKQHPTLAEVNREAEFWIKARDVLTRKRTTEVGQYRFSKQVGRLGRAGIGAAIGGTEEGIRSHSPEDALLGAAFAASFGAALESTAWRTVSPVVKDQVARLLASGRGRAAADLAIRVVGRARESTNPENR
jgi:hypothetical protein